MHGSVLVAGKTPSCSALAARHREQYESLTEPTIRQGNRSVEMNNRLLLLLLASNETPDVLAQCHSAALGDDAVPLGVCCHCFELLMRIGEVGLKLLAIEVKDWCQLGSWCFVSLSVRRCVVGKRGEELKAEVKIRITGRQDK
jgi:hypothetical protein